ncbi:MAG: SRPBCC domain-containing protein [Pseudonocardiaceae bacterium]|nr:MAG: SRPBCC domain-containing protein [Pseudonocardiaceae bacterium]
MTEPAPTRRELHIERVFDAPRDLLFQCLTDPAHLAHFWGPTGTSTPLETITVDPRPGGVFETVMVNTTDGTGYRSRAVFDVVDAPETLAWTEIESGMHVTIRLTALDEHRTHVHVHQLDVPEAGMTARARAGFLTALDRFDDYLAHLRSTKDDHDDPHR